MMFIGGVRRRQGEVFDVPSGTILKHLEVVDGEKPKAEKPKVEKKEPRTFSEISKSMPDPKGGSDLI